MTQEEIKGTLGLPIGTDGVGNCEQLLEGAGVLERLIASQNMASVRIDSDLPTLVDLLPKQAKTQRKVLQAVERLVGPRRQELVQFRLPRPARSPTSWTRTRSRTRLRELNRLEAFTYVPPFRGRAIRMIHRDLPFDELEIDFEALERRKALEYEKLNNVIRFALSGACRQREILRYFGEENAPRCGHCDNCRRHGRRAARYRRGARGEGDGGRHRLATMSSAAPDDDQIDGKVLEAVRMVLSGVARTQARFPCGKNLIAQMLCGSSNAKVTKLRLNKLSTFGLLKHLKQQEVLLMIDALMAMRCLQQVDLEQFRPVLELTEFGAEVMKGKAALAGALPVPAELLWKLQGRKKNEGGERKAEGECSPPSALCPPSSDAESADPDLLAALKQWRAEIADEAGVPRFQILSDATLAELARFRPTTREQLLTVKGIGPVKVERYGTALLEIGGEARDRERSRRRREKEMEGSRPIVHQSRFSIHPRRPLPTTGPSGCSRQASASRSASPSEASAARWFSITRDWPRSRDQIGQAPCRSSTSQNTL